ncbi:phage tail spike protein [Candidatus Enterococcus mangumiae]|uniref:Peptidase M23 n=1 Tax=Candidatus Enterococcus mangumiae TaxID=2230878 RepID=A0ABZ2SYC2_9ENTE|nr:phage tail spike protein [Enterococcus sp. DIV1094]MBO0489430.1 peptidoglycan DD-metalloendopeptidase family protein [Enterococcus sp. DIV1094]
MSETVYFFDHLQKMIKRKNKNKLIEVTQEKEITKDQSELMKDILYVTVAYDKEIEDARFMAVRESESSFSLYRIIKTNDPKEMLEFTGIGFAPDELDGYIIRDIRPSGQPVSLLLNRLIEFTDNNWRVEYVAPTLPAITTNFYYVSVREALKELQTFGMEFSFRCSLSSDGIKDKWIEVYKQIGKHSNMRFTYGSKALSVVKEVDRSSIATSIIGRGRGEEVGDGYGRRIEFADIEWKKSNGAPLDKPLGENWIEDPEATAKFGIPQPNGTMRKRETVVIFDDIEDPTELLQKTYETLVDASRPLAQFKAEVTGSDVIGNTVTIHRHDRNYHYRTRIFKVRINRLTGQTSIELGDNLTKDARRQSAQISNSISNLESNKMTFYESTEIGKFQDDIMRGAGKNGGSILLMNGQETGISDGREPYQMVFMNGKSIDTSDHFLVMNSDGIGFIEGDFWTDEFKTAWTIAGVFNANFIQAGKIRADIFETSFNGAGDQLKMANGIIQAINNGAKIMELTKNGMEYFYEGSKVGGMSTIGNPFPELILPEGQKIEGNSIFLRTEGNNRFIGLSARNGTGIIVGMNQLFMIQRRLDMIIDQVQVTGRLDVKELYVNGVKIDSNGGGGSGGGNGGSWNGQYPPEITSDRDKRYWQIWAMAIGAGFTQQAAAALLGNAQGESDANPTADEGNGKPGFGYGVWQWTDSTGASSGRVYMINLMTQAGITENPDTITAQFQLLMWHAPNGQWMATNAYPYTWTQFMGLTDIATATRAFEKNFERPLNDHPERVGWSTNWYNRFKDLSIPQSAGYITPISAPVQVTSEFGWRTSPITGAQEFHNGIDLVNNNPNTPIFASSEGEVIVAGAEYFSWYGNYVVIRHSDGIYTGYAHLSRVDVSVGQKVSQGQQLGLMGTTGPSTGEHLHFQFMDEFYPSSNARFHNPRNYINF